VDSLADAFGGNEIDRQHARQFIGLLTRLCREHDLTVVLLCHPSMIGMQSGTGTSGNTAWNNSVRSRLYLESQTDDTDLRTLSTKKSNYSKAGRKIQLRYANGAFVTNDQSSQYVAEAEAKVDHLFLKLLGQFTAEGREVTEPSNSQSFAPKVFAGHADAKGTSKEAFKAAMDRLLKAGRIHIRKVGPPSRQRSVLNIAGGAS
jgi:RecA-family ATPase